MTSTTWKALQIQYTGTLKMRFFYGHISTNWHFTGKTNIEYRDNRLINLNFRFHFHFDPHFEWLNSKKVSKLILKKENKKCKFNIFCESNHHLIKVSCVPFLKSHTNLFQTVPGAYSWPWRSIGKFLNYSSASCSAGMQSYQ